MENQKMEISSYLEYKIKNPAYVIGGNDVPQETTGGSSKKKYRRHWWQFWLPKA